MNRETVLSFSSIKEFAKSPAHFIQYKQGLKTESSAMRFGTAVHCAILEADKYADTYRITDHRRNTKAYKSMVADNPKKIYLTQSEFKTIQKIEHKIRCHELASDLIYNADEYEQELVGEIHGVAFKGFADAIGGGYILDLKTTQNGSPNEFRKSAYNFKYYLQGAIYSELTGCDDFWIITAESNAPHNITPYLLSKEYLERGKEELYKLIADYKTWIKDNVAFETQGYDYKLENESFFILDKPNYV